MRETKSAQNSPIARNKKLVQKMDLEQHFPEDIFDLLTS